ncbi:MAG: hypothetical protein J6R62_06335, partial [Rikenellaceae bacterium]|nr:hypothetical protein [Rikenellaceae bacterium]
MTKRFFQILAFGILLSITTLGSYAQTYDATTGISTPAPPGRFIENYCRRDFKHMTLERFQKESNREGKGKVYLQSRLEYPLLQKGDTMRIRYVFDNSVITHIEIEGVGETTPNDIEKGLFDVTVSPEQTTLYKTNIHVKSANDSIVVLEGIANRRVIVIDGDRREYFRVINNFLWARVAKDKPASEYRFLNSIAGDVPEGLWVYAPEKLNEYIGKISGKEVEMQIASEDIPDTKTLLQKETERFNNSKRLPDKWLHTSLEHAVIARGDSTRIKFVFDNREVYGIQVLGYGKASRDDIKKGEYVVTVSPQKTKLIECWVIKKGWRRIPAHYRVIVVDPEKYNEVMRKYYTLRAQGR